ncbi:hypothetical protein CEXT_705621 [Caerostris extrusa]|uniref:LAGLIDADG homing endonuclease n=1 Tax=Caerostris extrusa TaxID=172846 RepID=A0AAV4MR00_CAEEX|nr:hypothetical protein CEXT_705621 [Caerostris extrusa]
MKLSLIESLIPETKSSFLITTLLADSAEEKGATRATIKQTLKTPDLTFVRYRPSSAVICNFETTGGKIFRAPFLDYTFDEYFFSRKFAVWRVENVCRHMSSVMGDPKTVLEGSVKYRDKKKWKSRWAVVSKLSPVAEFREFIREMLSWVIFALKIPIETIPHR